MLFTISKLAVMALEPQNLRLTATKLSPGLLQCALVWMLWCSRREDPSACTFEMLLLGFFFLWLFAWRMFSLLLGLSVWR